MKELGRHTIIDFYGCDFDLLNDEQTLISLALESVEKSGATILKHYSRAFTPYGVTGVVVIAESHLTYHTWPEHGYLGFDYFTCGETVDTDLVVRAFQEHLTPSSVDMHVISRGNLDRLRTVVPLPPEASPEPLESVP